MDRDDYRTQLSTTGSPWLPKTLYGPGTAFLSYNAFRILTIQAKAGGVSGGGTNPDGSYWGSPFTQWGLTNAEVGATFKDGTVMWVVASITSTEVPPPQPQSRGITGSGTDSAQNPAIGGTPVAFFNYIDPAPFEPLIHEHWDFFNSWWMEQLGFVSQLYAVEIVFNAEILLSGRGAIPAAMTGFIPQMGNFYGPDFVHIKKQIGDIADRLGIQPVTMKNARLQLPNLVFITSPHLPKPGQSGPRERGGPFSNL